MANFGEKIGNFGGGLGAAIGSIGGGIGSTIGGITGGVLNPLLGGKTTETTNIKPDSGSKTGLYIMIAVVIIGLVFTVAYFSRGKSGSAAIA